MSGADPGHARPLLLLAALGLARAAAGAPGGSEAPPPASVRQWCLGCHEIDLVAQQRLGRAGWEREVDKMIRWGAPVPAAQKASLVADLEAASGTPRAAAIAGPGEELFRARCLVCHGADLTDQQRLGRPAWEREVDKMVRWGASVAPHEKASLVDHLVARRARP